MITVGKGTKRLPAVGVLAILLAGCASIETYSLRSSTDSSTAYRVVAQTIPTIGYVVEHSDPSAKIITAVHRLKGTRVAEKHFRLELSFQEVPNGTVVAATFIPPGTAFGSSRGEFKELVEALRQRLPDVTVVQR